MTVDLTPYHRHPVSMEMTGAEMKFHRKRLGLSTTKLGRAFGYVGTDTSVSGTIRKYESGQRPIPPWLARLLRMYAKFGLPPDVLLGPNDQKTEAPE